MALLQKTPSVRFADELEKVHIIPSYPRQNRRPCGFDSGKFFLLSALKQAFRKRQKEGLDQAHVYPSEDESSTQSSATVSSLLTESDDDSVGSNRRSRRRVRDELDQVRHSSRGKEVGTDKAESDRQCCDEEFYIECYNDVDPWLCGNQLLTC